MVTVCVNESSYELGSVQTFKRKRWRNAANSLPSLYSTRERVLALITDGTEKKTNIDTALQYLEEIKSEIIKMKNES